MQLKKKYLYFDKTSIEDVYEKIYIHIFKKNLKPYITTDVYFKGRNIENGTSQIHLYPPINEAA